MFNNFKSIDLSDNYPGYSIIQPSAGLIPAINARLKLYSDETGSLTYNIWAAIFVLACLHKHGRPVISETAQSLLGNDETTIESFSIRFMFCDSVEEDFRVVIESFLFSIDRDTLEDVFNAVDKSNYITKKTVDAEKND